MGGNILKPKSIEVGIGAGSTVGNNVLIRCFNNAAAVGVLSVANTADGTVSVSAGSNAAVGTGTYFQRDFAVNQSVMIGANTLGGQSILTISTITDNTHLTFSTVAGFTNATATISTIIANTTVAAYGEEIIQKSKIGMVVGTNFVATAIAFAD